MTNPPTAELRALTRQLALLEESRARADEREEALVEAIYQLKVKVADLADWMDAAGQYAYAALLRSAIDYDHWERE